MTAVFSWLAAMFLNGAIFLGAVTAQPGTQTWQALGAGACAGLCIVFIRAAVRAEIRDTWIGIRR